MSVEIEFPLDRARCAVEPSQIYSSLFEDFGCQFLLAGSEMVIVGSVHVVESGLLFLSQALGDLDFRESQISCANRSSAV